MAFMVEILAPPLENDEQLHFREIINVYGYSLFGLIIELQVTNNKQPKICASQITLKFM